LWSLLNRSENIIDLDIINHSFDSLDVIDKVVVDLYIINPIQQETVIADIADSEYRQVLWKLIGHELGSGNSNL
jgi:hypothetical protein